MTVALLLVAALPSLAILLGWYGARLATRSLPAPDIRRRPCDDVIAAALELLALEAIPSDHEIKIAARALYPRCPGDTFPDGTLRIKRLDEVMEAADLLCSVNAFDRDPPFPAERLLAYWNHRAGYFGQLWGAVRPSPALQRLRAQAVIEAR